MCVIFFFSWLWHIWRNLFFLILIICFIFCVFGGWLFSLKDSYKFKIFNGYYFKRFLCSKFMFYLGTLWYHKIKWFKFIIVVLFGFHMLCENSGFLRKFSIFSFIIKLICINQCLLTRFYELSLFIYQFEDESLVWNLN